MPEDASALKNACGAAIRYIEDTILLNPENDPSLLKGHFDRFFTFDAEKRSPSKGKPYLYGWSYYIGVVMEGLLQLGQAAKDNRCASYVRAYLDAMTDGDQLSPQAGYVPDHGLDCYKSASLLLPFWEDAACRAIAAALYNDLVCRNSAFRSPETGYNYWHHWFGGKKPKYLVWLDGLYMAQPFLAQYAAKAGDGEEMDRVVSRFAWVNAALRDPGNGLMYHAGSSREEICPFHWSRAIGWYMMAQINVIEALSGERKQRMAELFRENAPALLQFQQPGGKLWTNLTDQPESDVNRQETSASAMIIYALLKGVRLNILPDGPYRQPMLDAYRALIESKLKDGRLTDIYLMASANGQNNYENPDYYVSDEGKGVGPMIMATAEAYRALQRETAGYEGKRSNCA